MTRILIRTGKRPGQPVGPEASIGYRKHGVFAMNVGNGYYWDSVFRWVSVPGVEVVPDSLLSAHPEQGKRYYDAINAEFDQYVFTLTNSFRPTHAAGLHRWAEMIDKLTIPVIGVGGGVQLNWNEGLEPGDETDRGTKHFMKSLLNHSASVSVRGEITGAYLKRLGFGDEHVRVTGCPSLYLYTPDYEVKPKGPLTSDSKVGITIAVRDYGFSAFANRAYEQYPNLMYIGQTMGDIVTFVWGKDRLVAEKPDIPVHLGHPMVESNKTRMFLDPRVWTDFLKEYDFMLGTRIHGCVAALVGGTPATLISMDQRTHELGLFHDIPTIRRPDMKDSDTVATVFEQSDWTAFNKGLRPRFEFFCRFFEENGVAHIGEPGNENPAFDEEQLAAELPPPIEPILHHGKLDPEALKSRVAWLRLGGVPEDTLAEVSNPDAEDPRAVLVRLNELRGTLNETVMCEENGIFVPEFGIIQPLKNPRALSVYRRIRRFGGRILRRMGLLK
ncbi:MAG: polysaccharide pyruvyl transferase family protein [Micrococcales bacterium]|nr:polysaccharide pyruvyl transferase family protein [Micrococcales bacterium]